MIHSYLSRMKLNHDSKSSVVKQIAHAILSLCRDNLIQIGDPLPSEWYFAQALNQSLQAIQSTYQMLLDLQIIDKDSYGMYILIRSLPSFPVFIKSNTLYDGFLSNGYSYIFFQDKRNAQINHLETESPFIMTSMWFTLHQVPLFLVKSTYHGQHKPYFPTNEPINNPQTFFEFDAVARKAFHYQTRTIQPCLMPQEMNDFGLLKDDIGIEYVFKHYNLTFASSIK